MINGLIRLITKFLKVKKQTLKQYQKTQIKLYEKQQLVKMMQNEIFEAYYIGFLGKYIAQAYVFYDLYDKNLADGKNICYVCNVFVHSKFRRMGLATRCMKTIKEDAKNKGFSKMIIGVMENNTNAIKLYEKLGFVDTKEKYAYNAVIKDAKGNRIPQKEHLLMSCDL